MKEKNGDTITKNLTFRPIVIQKADQIKQLTGEEFSVLCARLINSEHERQKLPLPSPLPMQATAQEGSASRKQKVRRLHSAKS